MRPNRVLLVEANPDARERLGGWLEAAGYEVLACPGPGTPTYECVGSHTGHCALVAGTDTVVLNLHLDSDTVGRGTPAWELILLYAASGKPVVALTDHHDTVTPMLDAA